MTKKRFIKLIMSKGVQISEARKIALSYNSRKMPYSEAYINYLVEEKLVKPILKLGAVSAKLGEDFDKLTQSFKKFAEVAKNV